MPSKIERFEINGTAVLVEIDDTTICPSSSGRAKIENTAAGDDWLAHKITKVELGQALSAIVGPVHEALKTAKPDEVNVELSLGFKGGVGVFVAKSEGSAALKITAKWKFK